MPYITQRERSSLGTTGAYAATSGQLAYKLYKECVDYADGLESFTLFNEIIGVLDCVKEEFRRRHLNPYEDLKREENGDVDVQ